MGSKVSASERSDLEIKLDNESAVQALVKWNISADKSSIVTANEFTHPEYPDQNVKRNFKVVPIPVIRDLKQDELACPKGVHDLEVLREW